jgi:hypothetical protein
MVGGVGVCSLNATASGQCQGSKGPHVAISAGYGEVAGVHARQ